MPQDPYDRDENQILTTKALKALSHPVRRRITDVLSGGGPARAADLANDLDLPANQISFHLRTLADADLIVEAPEEARDRRDRVWRAKPEGLQVIDPTADNDPAHLAAIDAFMAGEVAEQTDLLRRTVAWLQEYAATGGDSDLRGDWSNMTLRLTSEEAIDLLGRLRRVVQDVRDATQTATPQDGEARHLWKISVLAARDDI